MGATKSTIELKLYKPSLLKRNILDEALENYSRAYAYLMEKAFIEIDEIKNNYKDSTGSYNANSISKWVNSKRLKELNEFRVEPFKDSLKIDFSAAIAGYISNKEVKSAEAFQKNLKQRPIYFCRYSKNRNYSLLYDAENNKYYAKLYLMNVKNEKRKKAAEVYNKKLNYIACDKEVYKEGENRRSFIIFPLAFGKWQENYLKEAIDMPEILKTARLIKRNSEYFLAINIVKQVEEAPEPINFMGISRGMDKALNYTVVDNKGNIILEGFEETVSFSKDKLNIIANTIVKMAIENSYQVILEKLTDKGDNLTFTDKQGKVFVPIINCSNYNKLYDIITYKLKANGFKEPIRVSAVNIFNTCPFCSHKGKSNRFTNNLLLCTSCGKTTEVERAGSINLARKLIHYNSEKIIIQVQNTTEGVLLINEELGLYYYPTNPFDCQEEFMKEIDKIILKFYEALNSEKQKENYKKRLSLIKRIENNSDIFKLEILQ